MRRKEDIERLIDKNERRLQKLLEKKAIFGLNTPVEILMEIEDIESELEKLQGESKSTPEYLPYEPETILIPAGPFWMGSDDGPANERSHKVNLPAYRIGKYPITNIQYLEFVKKTDAVVSPEIGWELAKVGQTPPKNKLNHPIVGVSWDDAVAYCQWLSEQTCRYYRLPTEAEWEKAARGSNDNQIYPWGNDWLPDRCNNNGQDTMPVDYYPAQGVYNCFDMVGNVWEWTSTIWGNAWNEPDYTYPYQKDERETMEHGQQLYREYRICRGGSYKDKPDRLRCSARARFTANKPNIQCGFRVTQKI